MVYVSNKTLAGLLAIAILISVIGTWIDIDKLTKGLTRAPEITGLPTEGNVTVTVLQQIAINVSNFTIDFGTGFVNDTFTYAYLDTEGGPNIPSGEGNSSGWNQSVRDQAFRIENVGSVMINVSVSANANGNVTVCQNETFGTDCGTIGSPPDCAIDNASSENYLCWWTNNQDTGLSFGEVNACKNLTNGTSNNVPGSTGSNSSLSKKAVHSASATDLACGYMNSSDAQDEFVFEVRIAVPYDAGGRKNVTFTFSGTGSGPVG